MSLASIAPGRASLARALPTLALGLVLGGPAAAQTVTAPYATNYSVTELGSVAGVPIRYGGLTFLDPNTLLVAGRTGGQGGSLYRVGVTRDAGGRIIGFSGAATPYAAAPEINGGVAVGPNGVVFYSTGLYGTIGEIKAGSVAPDRQVPWASASFTGLGTLAVIPTGFANAGQLAVANDDDNSYLRAVLTPDSSGTYDIATAPGASAVTLSGEPYGLSFVPVGSLGFTMPSILVSEYQTGTLAAYQLDANGDPIAGSRQAFVTGLDGPGGGAVDPVTGELLISVHEGGSTIGGDQLVEVSGFAAPRSGVIPEPSTWALLGAGLLATGGVAHRRRRNGAAVA